MVPWWMALLTSLAGAILLVAPDPSLSLTGADCLDRRQKNHLDAQLAFAA